MAWQVPVTREQIMEPANQKVQHPPSLVCKTSCQHPPRGAVTRTELPFAFLKPAVGHAMKINGQKKVPSEQKRRVGNAAALQSAGMSHPTISFCLGGIFLPTSSPALLRPSPALS